MSEFCKQCSEALFGPDHPTFNDAKGLCANGETIGFLCEACLPKAETVNKEFTLCIVDHEGTCLSKDHVREGEQDYHQARISLSNHIHNKGRN